MKRVPNMTRIPTLIALVLLAAAPAADAGGGQASTFSGECHFEGVVRFSPPLTNEPQPGRGEARAAGPCTGTWTDRRGRTHELDGDRVRYFAANQGEISCGGGTAEGGGYLRYRGDKLRFALTETRAAPAAELHLEGSEGGSADALARVSEDEDALEIAQKCSGPGLDRVGLVIDLLPTPGISG
jgi:hypothetical protein